MPYMVILFHSHRGDDPCRLTHAVGAYPYPTDAGRANPDDVVWSCETHGAWWHVPPVQWRARIRTIDGLPGDWAGRIDVYLDTLNSQGVAHRGTWDGTRVVWSTRPPYRKLAAQVDRMVPAAIGGGE